MMKEDILEPTTTDYATPFVFAPKETVHSDIFIDCQMLNNVTIRVSKPLPARTSALTHSEKGTFLTLNEN